MMNSLVWILFLTGILPNCVLPQIFTSVCRANWVLNDKTCYRFVYDIPLVIEEASAYCWRSGSTLVSVTSPQTHDFLNKWLRNNDIVMQNTWFTSGSYGKGVLIWEGVGTHHMGPTYWIRPPVYNDRSSWVAYKLDTATGNYGWANVTGGIASSFICEVPISQIYNMEIINREQGYGSDVRDIRDYRAGPSFIENPLNTVVIKGESSVHIDCISTGNPLPQYTWYVRGQSNVTEVTSSKNTRYTITGSRLTIQDPDYNDAGIYYCKASNELGSAYSETAEIFFGYLGYFPNIQNAPVIVDAFTGTKFDCSAPSYSPEVRYEWHKAAPIYVFIWPANPNMFVSNSGLMYTSEVQPTDADKTYYCMVTLTHTATSRLSTSQPPSRESLGIFLGLTETTQTDNNYGPIINTHAFPSPMLVGLTVRLECIAYGSLPLTYSWHRQDGRPFEKGTEITHLGRVLTIYDAALTAEGNYVCTCVRNTGRRASKIVIVAMEAKPYFPYPIGNLYPDVGMTVRWYCRAVARPKATYTWYKDGKQLVTVPGQIEIVGGILTFVKVTKSRDEGTYQCAATNQHGTTFSTGQMSVLEIAPNFKRHPMPSSIQAGIGGTLVLPCGVEAAPLPQVTWTKNGANLNLNPGDTGGRIGMTSQFTLIINDIINSDEGYYMCHASNVLGEARNATVVDVIPGITIDVPPVPTTVQVNRTAFLFCSISRDYLYRDLVYIWRFNGREIDPRLAPEYVSGLQSNLNGLYITHAQYKHAGIYECEAKTTLHSDRRSAILSVRGPPGPVAGLHSDDRDIAALSILLIWTLGQGVAHGAPVESYDIEAETDFYPGIWDIIRSDIPDYLARQEATGTGRRDDQRVWLIEDLTPNTNYRFRVRAVNAYGRGQEASKPSLIVKTIQTPPRKAPAAVGGGEGKVGTLNIAWEPLDVSEYCGSGLGYYVYWKKPNDTRDWKRERASDERSLTEGMYTVTVGEDNYYTQYLVKVGAFNDKGHGPNSTEHIVMSAEGMPNSVPVLSTMDGINGSSIIVNWEPVKNDRETMKGRVAGYRTYYYVNLHGDTPFDGTEPDPVLNRIMFKDVYGQTDHVQLIGLMPNNEYFARVQVFNTAGAGPKGEWRRGETANMVLRDFPTHIKVFPHSIESVTVQWRGIGIHYDEEVVQGYRIRVWKLQEDIRTAVDTKVGKVQSAVVHELQQQTVYVLRVLGYSKAGDGALSPVVYFSINAGQLNYDPTSSEICFLGFGYDNMCSSSPVIIYSPISMLITCLLTFLFVV